MATLVGVTATPAGTADNIGKGQAIAQQFVCGTSGTVDTINWYTNGWTVGAPLNVSLGIFADSANAIGSLLEQHTASTSLPTTTGYNAYWPLAGFATAVTSSTTYWLAMVFTAAGGTNFAFPDGVSSARNAVSVSTAMTDLTSVTTWTYITTGPWGFNGSGGGGGGAAGPLPRFDQIPLMAPQGGL